jgi:hypothetical protein
VDGVVRLTIVDTTITTGNSVVGIVALGSGWVDDVSATTTCDGGFQCLGGASTALFWLLAAVCVLMSPCMCLGTSVC